MSRPALLILLAAHANADDRLAEDCEACGLVAWRLETIVATKRAELEGLRAATEARAAKSTKAHSKRWIKKALHGAIEAEVESLMWDERIVHGACRSHHHEGPIEGSALRGSDRFARGCRARVSARVFDLIGEAQDEIIAAIVAGRDAGAACASALKACDASRAKLLLGAQYDAAHKAGVASALDMLQVGVADRWDLHKDVDESVYWFNRATLTSVKEPPAGWVKDAEGQWIFDPTREEVVDLTREDVVELEFDPQAGGPRDGSDGTLRLKPKDEV